MKASSKTIGLLIEIILSTVFFSVICTVVLQILWHAQNLQQYSREKSKAMVLSQSVGDVFRSRVSDSGDGFDLMLGQYYENALIRENDGRYTILLDEEMNPCPKEKLSPSEEKSARIAGIDILEIKKTPAGTLSRAFIHVERQGKILYQLAVDIYRQGDGT